MTGDPTDDSEPTDDEGHHPATPSSGTGEPSVENPDGFDSRSATESDAVEDVPTLTCSRCDREWDLTYELEDLQVGNRAVEQFALDHQRHTGHYPDGVTPWLADCQQCPEREPFLAERPAHRFAEGHARHTGHPVTLTAPESGTSTVGPEDVR